MCTRKLLRFSNLNLSLSPNCDLSILHLVVVVGFKPTPPRRLIKVLFLMRPKNQYVKIITFTFKAKTFNIKCYIGYFYITSKIQYQKFLLKIKIYRVLSKNTIYNFCHFNKILSLKIHLLENNLPKNSKTQFLSFILIYYKIYGFYT